MKHNWPKGTKVTIGCYYCAEGKPHTMPCTASPNNPVMVVWL